MNPIGRRTLVLLPFAMGGAAALRAWSRRSDAPAPRGPDVGFTAERLAMGTVWQVTLPPGHAPDAPAAAGRALDEVQRLEDRDCAGGSWS